MGAVVLTRFGTREYPEGGSKIVPVAVSVPEIEEIPDAFLADVTVETEEINATKSAIELADAEGIDCKTIKGTGADGRIVLNDVRKAVKNK